MHLTVHLDFSISIHKQKIQNVNFGLNEKPAYYCSMQARII